MPTPQYIIIALFLYVILSLFLLVARRFNIIDQPDKRSSHSRPTIRGGGIIFTVSALIWFVLFGQQDPWAILGLMLISFVSFWDDIRNIPAGVRFVVHLVAVSLLFFDMGIFGYYWYWIALAYILTVGCINAVNFMDGINGITAFYGLVTLGAFSLLNNAERLLLPYFADGLPHGWESFVPGRLVGVLFMGVLVFSLFNARKRAVTFAGDVGSISIAFILSWFMIALMVMSNNFYWILLFVVYGVDAGFTILVRIQRKENILQPHRLHLYQLLVNEKGWSHLLVAALYAAVQLVINVFTIWLTFSGNMNLYTFLLICVLIYGIYVIARQQITPNS